ncbi:alginate O-acetyltransferase AlgX-related protein [Pseudomonas sp. CCOS 191]|uniref:alginate O-acetyltransferase AlgX-related protein n=1 Tax=Pseudomonas sp. CCOS 191 TaxID=1649877 RepID=UPI0006244458|nr:hypothetical protein [Pseudomonas sp. CCOS 191]CRI59805.1 hypothetical protein CCOS191_5269 [Pseudomonas sp. CCOS 191]
MKRSVFVFVLSVLLLLLCVPAVNILTAKDKSEIKLTDKSFLYNMDFVSRWTAELLYPFGISTSPDQVIIGKDNWLYLGDMYSKTLTEDRRSATEADQIIGRQVGEATERWAAYLASKGVALFRIMIGPNKGSIYPEHMPTWAVPVEHNPTRALLQNVGPGRFVDLRSALLAAKQTHAEALYFKTDTHWNELGASLGFQAFAKEVAKTAPELRWPSEGVYEVTQINPRQGGDLARFLRLTDSLADTQPVTNVSNMPVKTVVIDYNASEVMYEGGNLKLEESKKPLLVKTTGALNDKKVLWLRDSFGTAMSPLMAATFSEVLQIHWIPATKPDGDFKRLVEKFKPDYVFFTVVERDARSLWADEWMETKTQATPAPAVTESKINTALVATNGKGRFIPTSNASPLSTNHLKVGASMTDYEVIGDDAFVEFSFTPTTVQEKAKYLNIEFSCADGSASAPVQLYWMEEGMTYYDEAHSAWVTVPKGKTSLALDKIENWPINKDIRRLRVDIDPVDKCSRFKLESPSFGIQN